MCQHLVDIIHLVYTYTNMSELEYTLGVQLLIQTSAEYIQCMQLNKKEENMEKIITRKNEYEVEFVAVGNQTIVLKSHNPINDDFSDGFLVYSDEVVIDDYSKFNTVYNQIDEYTIELSNDGSVYTEPIVIESTEEELAEMERQQKITELSSKISELKYKLKSDDYIIIKLYEASLVGDNTISEEYDIVSIHTERDNLRSQINELEEELKIL